MPKVKNTKHRVQVTNLPEGFQLIDGELVQMKHGGHTTGDQNNYGLTTVNPYPAASATPKDTDVRYSLSSVPREQANIEAEGGETVLTDLNNDGQFGLYDITGPRHSSGGVPMYLPEQSFIYSDTQKMKMGKEMLTEHGIQSRKKMTPAKVSKRYELNKYYGLLNDEYADKVQANTAELMLHKNKEGLSKLAFGQEMMKNFEEGVPLAAYPYLESIGIDPFEFAASVENITPQQVAQNVLGSLPPEQLAQMEMMQQFAGPPSVPTQQPQFAEIFEQQPMAKYGAMLDEAQYGGGLYGYDNPYMPQNFNQFFSQDESFRRPIQSAYMPMDLGMRGNVVGALNNLAEGATRMFGKKDRDGDGLADGAFRDLKAKRKRQKLKKAASYNYDIQVDPNDPNYDAKTNTTNYVGTPMDLYNASKKNPKKRGKLKTAEEVTNEMLGNTMMKYNPETMKYDYQMNAPEFQSKFEENRPDLTGYKSMSQLHTDLSKYDDPQKEQAKYLAESLTDYQKQLASGNLPAGTQFGMGDSGGIGYYDQFAPTPEGSQDRINAMMMGDYGKKYGGGLPKAQFMNSEIKGAPWNPDYNQQTYDYTNADPGQLTADLIENQSNQEKLSEILGKDMNKPNPTPAYDDPTVTKDKGKLGTRLARGVDNMMTSPGMNMFTEGSMFATGIADVVNQWALNKRGKQAEQDMLKNTMADSYMGVSYDPVGDQGYWDTNTGLINRNIQGDPSVGGGFAGAFSRAQYGNELRKAQGGLEPGTELIGGSDDWTKYYQSDAAKDYRDARYKAYVTRRESDEFKDRASQRNLAGDVLTPEEYHDLYVKGEQQINAIQNFYKDNPEYLKRGTWDKHYDWDTDQYATYDEARAANAVANKGQNWMYKKAIQDINAAGLADDPDFAMLSAMTPEEIAQFESGYIGGQLVNSLRPEQVQEMRQKGLNDQIVTINGKQYAISPESGYFGNTLAGQQEIYTIPGEPEPVETPCDACPDGSVPEKDENGNCMPCPEIEAPDVPDVAVQGQPPIKEPWIQDILKTRAIADRRRALHLPWQPSVRRNQMDVVLEDPTRAIAARNSQLAAAQEAMGAFGGKNQLMANLSAAQGQAADDIANVVAGVNARNVGTVNQANQINAGLEQQFNQLEDERRTTQYNDTVRALQTHMDEQNFDREQYADAMANMITNMSDTYNMNQMYDLFNIRPLAGGDVQQTGSKAFQPSAQGNEWAFMNDYVEAAKRAKTLGLTDKDGNVDPNVLQAIIAQKQGASGYTDPREAAWKDQYRSYMSGYQGRRKGGESKMKKWVVPFYTGKMGM